MSIVTRNRSKSKQRVGSFLDIPQNDHPRRRILAFTFVVIGILARWFWPAAWAYLADPTQTFFWEALPTIPVRLLLSLCIAALTFLPVYQKIYRLSTEDWVICFLAFQYGFFWQSILFSVMQNFR